MISRSARGDTHIEFIKYGINHKSLRPTPSIFTAAAQKRDLHSRGAEPGIKPGGPAVEQKPTNYYLYFYQ